MRELITQASDVLQSNPMFASSPPLTRGLDANKKNEIQSAGSQDISSLNLGVVNSSQTYGTLQNLIHAVFRPRMWSSRVQRVRHPSVTLPPTVGR